MIKTLTIFSILLVTLPLSAQHQALNYMSRGKYDVSFQVLSLYDSSRTTADNKSYRPVQVSVWFPAHLSGKSDPFTNEDYFILSAAETQFQVSKSMQDSAIIQYENLLQQNGVSNKTVRAWFDLQMLADENAVPLNEKFPLIVVAQGNYHSAHHQAFLCEFIASNGYVVATTPSQTRISGPMTDDSQAVESAEEQVKDMEFAISSLHRFTNIDFNNIALIGHSFGGRSVLLLQMKNNNVRCLVSLDGGIGLGSAVEDIKKSPYYDSDKMNVPLLHFYEDTDEFIIPDFSLINSFDRSERFLVKINDFHHYYFSSIGVVSGQLDGFSPDSQNLADKCKLIFYFTLDFVDAVFKDDEEELIKLKEKFSSAAAGSELIEFQLK
ncbi:MAG: dienelactone hydrolase family protein [bacterium]|nr:dienelactone hydrolase family protein [bacterium]